MSEGGCVQERYAPRNHCFGCGPANPQGLHVRSFEEGDDARRALDAGAAPRGVRRRR